MHSLDTPGDIKKLDKVGIADSIARLPGQIKQSWSEVNSMGVPASCSLAKNVVVTGMGGSALGGRIADSLLLDRSRAPIEIFTEYRLPNYVNSDSLVILSSYSGNTEETLSCANEALNRGAVIYCITTGGKLGDFMKQNSLDGYIIDPKQNPSNQPRMGLGYSIASILAVLAKCEFINILSSEVDEAVATCEEFIKDMGIDEPEHSNLAKKTARKLKGKIPILVASEHLVGIVHAFKNQLNENSKTFSCLYDLPELNHHLMEGLRNPAEAKRSLHFLFFYSDLYSKEVCRRYPITYEVVGKNEVSHDVYTLRSRKKLNQIFETLVFGSFTSFYLSMLYDIDPAPIPWVDFFKERLSKG